MNKFLVIILFTALSFTAAAQKTTQTKRCERALIIQKGYYTIGDNADKLPANKKPVRLFVTRKVKEPLRKGYAAMETKERPAIVIDLPPSKRQAKKGYYAIDDQRNDSLKLD